MNNKSSYLAADWSQTRLKKPDNVHAFTTLRNGGVSIGDFNEYNLAKHVGDDAQSVKSNRAKLVEDLYLPAEPVWLEQVHSNIVICADDTAAGDVIPADASFSRKKGVVCAVMTADCLPVFFCNQAGNEVAVAHAGWRGLHAGIISNTIAAMQTPADEILVSLGPAIGPQMFEVGEEVLHAFVSKNSINKTAFVATSQDRYLCDIYQLAHIELQSIGIGQAAGGGYCTYSEAHRFYSYRKQQNTGRMASLIWLT
ncbi:MAG: peptidoglycan editing factor PgeF [Gammaproteobacteria bacterium]|nr:peptidoglycan editing factor PgeF [Gammaproteobacteria bacterium]